MNTDILVRFLNLVSWFVVIGYGSHFILTYAAEVKYHASQDQLLDLKHGRVVTFRWGRSLGYALIAGAWILSSWG